MDESMTIYTDHACWPETVEECPQDVHRLHDALAAGAETVTAAKGAAGVPQHKPQKLQPDTEPLE